MVDGTICLLNSGDNFKDCIHIKVIKKLVVTEDTKFSTNLETISGGPVINSH
jgi:hypothetical protein